LQGSNARRRCLSHLLIDREQPGLALVIGKSSSKHRRWVDWRLQHNETGTSCYVDPVLIGRIWSDTNVCSVSQRHGSTCSAIRLTMITSWIGQQSADANGCIGFKAAFVLITSVGVHQDAHPHQVGCECHLRRAKSSQIPRVRSQSLETSAGECRQIDMNHAAHLRRV